MIAPVESGGTSVARAVMDGRYVITDHTGKMQMPGPDGAMMDTSFIGMTVEGSITSRRSSSPPGLTTWARGL